ncbi:MAG: hypothetical protein H7831_05355, partial [Magnetococcus sp. WYHC-3]
MFARTPFRSTLAALALLLSGHALLSSEGALLSTARAEVPRTISYQGYLTTGLGTPVSGSRSIRFTMYDAASGGSALWTETHNVSVVAGWYSVVLGSGMGTSLTLPFDRQYYLGIKVGMDSEMAPRHRLTASPYTLRANTTETVADGAVGTAALADGAVTSGKINATGAADGAVLTVVSNGSGTPSVTWALPSSGMNASDLPRADNATLRQNGTILSVAPGGITSLHLGQVCGGGQVLKYLDGAWSCAEDGNSGGDITAVVAGAGLTGGADSGSATLSLNVDNDTLTLVNGTLRLGSAGIGADLLAGAPGNGSAGQVLAADGSGNFTWVTPGNMSGVVAGEGLAGGGSNGSVTLSVNVDNSSLAVSNDTLTLVTGGITTAHLGTAALNSLTIAATTLTANATLGEGHGVVPVNTSSGAVTLTLPSAAASAGRVYTVVLVGGNNSITLAAGGSDTLGNGTSVTLDTSAPAMSVISNGTAWHPMGGLVADVDADNSTLTLSSGVLSLRDGGVGAAKLSGSPGNGTSGQLLSAVGNGSFAWVNATNATSMEIVAGLGLSGGGNGSNVTLNLTVDNATLAISNDTVAVAALGINTS